MNAPLPSRRQLLFALLYFAEGAPMGFIWWALPTLLRSEGVPVDEITGLTSLVILPWALKFAWAPLVDMLTTARFGFRAWIVSAQVAMGVTLLPLLFVGLDAPLPLIATLLVVHAVAAATQDVAVDALSIALVPRSERGSLNGWMQAGMLSGRACFGGGALLVGGTSSGPWIIGAMIAVLWLTPLALLRASIPPLDRTSRGSLRRFGVELRAVLRQRVTWVAVAFALVGEVTFKSVGSVMGPYLIDQQVSESQVGLFFGIGSVAAMTVGALFGGRLADRFGRRTGIVLGQALVVVPTLVLAVSSGAPGVTGVGWTLLCVLYLGIGIFIASSFALFMDFTSPRLGATQFSGYMGLTNLCEAWSSRMTGRVVTTMGYGPAFAFAALLGVGALALLWPLRSPEASEPRAVHGDPSGS